MVGGREVGDVPQEKSERRRRWKAKGHVSTSETRGGGAFQMQRRQKTKTQIPNRVEQSAPRRGKLV